MEQTFEEMMRTFETRKGALRTVLGMDIADETRKDLELLLRHLEAITD